MRIIISKFPVVLATYVTFKIIGVSKFIVPILSDIDSGFIGHYN